MYVYVYIYIYIYVYITYIYNILYALESLRPPGAWPFLLRPEDLKTDRVKCYSMHGHLSIESVVLKI